MQPTLAQSRCLDFGFTLLELVVSISIVLILLGMGIPAFRALTAKSLQASEINAFVHHFHLARSLSITNQTHHVLCPSSDGVSCTNSGEWGQGYILYEDSNPNRSRDQNEQLQAVHRPDQEMGIDIESSQYRRFVVYGVDGRPSGYNLTLTFCDPNSQIPPKAVILNNLGRVRVSESRWDGSALSCGGDI